MRNEEACEEVKNNSYVYSTMVIICVPNEEKSR